MSDEKKLTYKDAGVDIEKSTHLLEEIKSDIKSTFRKEVIGDIGKFGGLFAPVWKDFKDPVLVSSIDGVGTKLDLAAMSGNYKNIVFIN